MRYIITTIFCLLCSFGYCQKDEPGTTVTLIHKGEIVNVFTKSTCLEDAYAAAEEGDSLYLGKGTYYISTIDKAIAIIGLGMNYTWVESNTNSFYINIGPKENTTIGTIRLEGINTDRWELYVGQNQPKNTCVENLFIKKCSIAGPWSQVNIKNIEIESCHLRSHTYLFTAEQYHINNCIIQNLAVYRKDNSLVLNCNIANLEPKYYDGLYVNCIIGQVGLGIEDTMNSNAYFVNCLYHNLSNFDPLEGCGMQDCYSTTENLVKDVDEWGGGNITITKEQLEQNKYYGTDGTVVGIYGGIRPYSTDMHLPFVVKNYVTMDKNKKKAIVNVNVTAN